MMIVCMILSGLALLAAVANIILFSVEKKRNERRHKAMLDYIRNECSGTIDATKEHVKDCFASYSQNIDERFAQQQYDIDRLKNGACPDYEKALAAANAVNDFNAGISAIMNFDPIAAAKARRQSGDKEVS